MSATARPWRLLYEGSGDYLILGPDGTEIAARPDAHFAGMGPGAAINEANAALIVDRVNATGDVDQIYLNEITALREARKCLLAVARAAADAVARPVADCGPLVSALTVLETAHPDWRTWS